MSTVQFYYDKRLYGIDQSEWGDPSDCDMRIPNELFKSVVFICRETSDGSQKYTFLATAFLFSVPIDQHPLLQCIYLVTAKHVIQGAKQHGYDLHIRINRRDGDAEFLPLREEWIYIDESGIDIAVYSLPFGEKGSQGKYDCESINSAMILSPMDNSVHAIGVGESVFTIGLFSEREGKRRNIPILRVGNIAAVPDEELIDNDSGYKYHAYLVDMISTSGLSGGPVFAFCEPRISDAIVNIPDQMPTAIFSTFGRVVSQGARIYLLGMIRGHWEMDSLNMGVAIVTPIGELMTLIFSDPRLQQVRRQIIEKDLRQKAPILDTKN
jgi:hypothetical protein